MSEKANPDSFGTYLRGLKKSAGPEAQQRAADYILRALRTEGVAPTTELAARTDASIVDFARALEALVKLELVSVTGQGDDEVVTLTPRGERAAPTIEQ